MDKKYQYYVHKYSIPRLTFKRNIVISLQMILTDFKQIIGVKKPSFWCSGKHVLKIFLLFYNFVYVCILPEHFAAIV